jgi:TolB-like protein
VRKVGLIIIFGALTIPFMGCGGTPKSYVDHIIGLDYVKCVAVLPFENHTQAVFAEERLRDIVCTEMLSRGLFDVIEKGDLQRFLHEEVVGKKQQLLDPETAQRLAEELKVEAYMAGAVNDYTENRNGTYSYPVVAVTLRLVDIKTGKIIWQASGSESGYSTWDRLFGFASDDFNRVSFKLVERLLKSIHKD